MYGTPQDVIDLTGVSPQDLSLQEETDLHELLETWLKRIESAINVRLEVAQSIRSNDTRYLGLVDISIRTVGKMVLTAQQQRLGPLVQVGDFNVQAIDSTDVIRGLEVELKPYQRKVRRASRVQFFSSIPTQSP